MVWLVLQCKMRWKSIHNMYQLPEACNHIKTKRKQNSKIKHLLYLGSTILKISLSFRIIWVFSRFYNIYAQIMLSKVLFVLDCILLTAWPTLSNKNTQILVLHLRVQL